MLRTTPLIALATAAFLCLSTAHAGRSIAEPAPPRPEAFTGVLKLQKTYHEVGTAGGLALPPSVHTAYGTALVVNCAATAGCYILAEAEAQYGPVASEGSVALCVRINGSSTDGCPFLGRSSTAGFTSFSHRGGLSVPVGNHTVTTTAYSSVDGRLYNFNTSVKLYKK